MNTSDNLTGKRNLPLLIGGAGCLLLLGAVLLLGIGFLLGSGNLSDLAADSETSSSPPTAATTPTLEAPVAAEASRTPTVAPTATLAAPEMGNIVFAPSVTGNMEAVGAADSFDAGISTIHAVFEYNNLSRDNVWERVWYLDGEEMLRSSEAWSGDSSGAFDYFLDTGGEALPPGKWTLELYLDGSLMASASFVINAEPTPTAAATPKAPKRPTPTVTPKPAATYSNRVYQLAYTKWDGGHHNVYIANTNGQGEKFIVSRAAGPSWSADGKQLFFYGEAGVNQQERPGQPGCEFGTISDGIVAIDLTQPPGDVCAPKSGPWFCERKEADNQTAPSDVCTESGIRVFQNLDWKEGTARWASVAPDGDSVAFDAKPGGNDYRIYFRSILDNQQYRFELIGEQASWSPNSQQLVCRSGRNNQQGLWISNRDDSGHFRITDDGSDSYPAWSPDGRTIAFSRSLWGNVDIYAVNVDGSNLRRLTNAPGPDTLPVYTPDGHIIFRSARNGSWGIWKMNGSGGGQREIIANADVGPDWAYSRMDVR